jgi:hypothetical protein
MADASRVAYATVNGTTSVSIASTDNAYGLYWVQAWGININIVSGTTLNIKDNAGVTVVSIPLGAPTTALAAITGKVIDVGSCALPIPNQGPSLMTAQLSNNLVLGSLTVVIGIGAP